MQRLKGASIMSKFRPVTQYKGSKFVAQYHSAAFAALVNKVDPSHVAKVARGERNTTGGWEFSYINRITSSHNSRHVTIRSIDGTILAKFKDTRVASEILSGVFGVEIPQIMLSNDTALYALNGYARRHGGHTAL